jgi:hypothetical protein
VVKEWVEYISDLISMSLAGPVSHCGAQNKEEPGSPIIHPRGDGSIFNYKIYTLDIRYTTVWKFRLSLSMGILVMAVIGGPRNRP